MVVANEKVKIEFKQVSDEVVELNTEKASIVKNIKSLERMKEVKWDNTQQKTNSRK